MIVIVVGFKPIWLSLWLSLFDRCEEDGLLSLCLSDVFPEEWSDSEDQVDVYNLIERYVVTISSLIDNPHGMYSHNQ